MPSRPPSHLNRTIETDPLPITPCQAATMALVCEGFTAKQIARERGVSPKTIEVQILRARERLNAKNAAQAAVLYDRLARATLAASKEPSL